MKGRGEGKKNVKKLVLDDYYQEGKRLGEKN